MTMLPPINTGSSTRLMTNALVRTDARYSRTAMTSTLRMVVLPGFWARDADEDVMQGRPRHLEMAHLAAPHQSRQHLLRIRISIQAQLLKPAEVRDFQD